MAQTLGSLAVGSIVKINENDSPVNYIIVHQGLPSSIYDESCNGTWVLRQDIYANRTYSTFANVYPSSNMPGYCNTFLTLLDSNMQSAAKQVKIPYVSIGAYGPIVSGENGFSCKIFLLSGIELGFSPSQTDYIPSDGAKLEYFDLTSSANSKRVANRNNTSSIWWTRSPANMSISGQVVRVDASGAANADYYGNSFGMRPAFILPSNIPVDDNMNVLAPPQPPATLSNPAAVMQSQTTDISWSQVAEADSYILQRLVDSGSWTTIYTGPNLTYTDTIGNWSTVQYRVQAGLDGSYGDYNTSSVIQVLPASNLLISGTDGSLGTITSDVNFSILTDTGNQFTYTVTVNGSQWYSGQATSYNGALSIMELPTGTGTIVISASVMTSAGQVSVDRNWTYTKAVATFPSVAQIGTLQYENVDFLPTTLAELVRTNPFWGGNLDKALEKILSFVSTPGVQIVTGSYIGTGGYGKSNENALTVGEKAKVVLISGGDLNSYKQYSTYVGIFFPCFLPADYPTTAATSTSGFVYLNSSQGVVTQNKALFSNGTLKWFSADDQLKQLNGANFTYSYVILS